MHRPALEVSSIYSVEGFVLLRLAKAAIPAKSNKTVPPMVAKSFAGLLSLVCRALTSNVIGSKLALLGDSLLPPSPTMTKGAQAEG